jgi:hypothetical protein
LATEARDEQIMRLNGMSWFGIAIEAIHADYPTTAEIHRLTSALATVNQGDAGVLIQRLVTGSAGQNWSLQERMGLKNNKQLYCSIQVSH